VHTYLRILKMLRNYWVHLVVSVFFMIIFSFLNGFSLWLISPFLSTLFASNSGDEISMLPELPSVTVTVERPDSLATEQLVFTESDSTATGAGANETASQSAIDPASRAEELRGKVTRLTQWRDGIKNWADSKLMRGTKMESLWRIVVVFFLLTLVKNICGYIQSVTISYVGHGVIRDLREGLFKRYTTLPLAFFHQHRSGELISRATNDVLIVNRCVSVSFTNLVRDPVFIVMYFFLAFIISWQLTLLALLVLPLSLSVIIRIGKKLHKYSHRQQEKMANLTSILQEMVYGIRVIKAFAMERMENRKFLRQSAELFKYLIKSTLVERLAPRLSEQLSVGVGLFILWYGGQQVIIGEQIPPDLFILFLVFIFSLIHPIRELSQVNNAIQEGLAAAERIFLVMDTATELQDEEDGVELTTTTGAVRFDNVGFEYRPGEPVLHDINLEVKAGEIVALVGSSGAGKSTAVDLIPRFYDPQHGRILIDGQDIREVKISSLRRTMGIVTQEVILFNDSVANNIAFGQTDVPQADIEAAARAANAHEFIEQLPEGYKTFIGDRGVKLSGGQRQRISIARAILKNPAILILDEATSALDTEAELQVQEAIDQLGKSRTTFVIAHRLSTIQSVDRIYVLKEGRVVQIGSHVELLSAEGMYKDLYSLQFRNGIK